MIPTLLGLAKNSASGLSENFPYTSSVDLVVASPLRRTLYTALLSFPSITKPIIALPEVQEASNLPCDTGSDKDDLIAEFQDENVDLTLLTDDWNSKTNKWAPTKPALEARCVEARKWLMERKEKHIAVVTHGGVLHYLTEDWSGFYKYAG